MLDIYTTVHTTSKITGMKHPRNNPMLGVKTKWEAVLSKGCSIGKGENHSGRHRSPTAWETEVQRLTEVWGQPQLHCEFQHSLETQSWTADKDALPHDWAGQPLPPSFMTLVKSSEPTGAERTPTGFSLTSTHAHLDTETIINNYNQDT